MSHGPTSANYDEAGTTKIGLIESEDLLGSSNIKFQGFHQVGANLNLQHITGSAQTADLDRFFPYDGDGLLDAYNSGTPSVTLDASGVDSALDGAGLLVVMRTGPATGEWKKLVTYTPGSRSGQIQSTFTSGTPVAGNAYNLLINCYKMNQLNVVGELASSDQAKTLLLQAWLFDCGDDGADTPTKRVVRVAPVVTQEVLNTGINTYSSDGSTYRTTFTYSVVCRGYTGAKIRVLGSGGVAYKVFAGAS